MAKQRPFHLQQIWIEASAASLRGRRARELQYVALCMAADDAVRHRRQRAKQHFGVCEVAAAEGSGRTAGWQAD